MGVYSRNRKKRQPASMVSCTNSVWVTTSKFARVTVSETAKKAPACVS
jgi:hypothetical protein